jgi:hypothetical protein
MYKTREEWLGSAVEEVRALFGINGYPLPEKIRVTCGFASKGGRGKVVGEHWAPDSSADATHEISVSPTIAEPVEVLGILMHELCHSATLGDGHKGRFPSAIRSVWLEGKPTTTTVGQKFKENFASLLEELGAYPHAVLDARQHIPQSTRLLKAVCTDCDYTIRLTRKWATLGLPTCVCGGDFKI